MLSCGGDHSIINLLPVERVVQVNKRNCAQGVERNCAQGVERNCVRVWSETALRAWSKTVFRVCMGGQYSSRYMQMLDVCSRIIRTYYCLLLWAHIMESCLLQGNSPSGRTSRWFLARLLNGQQMIDCRYSD